MSTERTQLSEQVRAIVAKRLRVAWDRLDHESSFEELGADSLSVMEIVLTLDARFQIRIPDDVATRLSTVGEAVAYVERYAV